MTSLPSSVDVAIIGAGAAGLGAAHALKDSGLSFIVLEARDRVGGRGHTIMAAPDVVFDVGCGWLHSANENSFVKIAEELNFEVNKDAAAMAGARLWQGLSAGRARRFHPLARSILPATATKPQRAATTAPADLYLEPGNRWNPMIDAISTYINGCELDQVSILDFDAYEDTNLNWRVRRGYGALMAAYGATLPLAFNCVVTLIDHSAKRLRIETSQGALDGRQGHRHRADQSDRR